MIDPRPIIEIALDKLPFAVDHDHATDNSYVVVEWTPATLKLARAQFRRINAAMNAIGYRRYSTEIKRGCSEARYAPKGYKPTSAERESIALIRELGARRMIAALDPTSLAHWSEIHVEEYERREDESFERARVRVLKAWKRGECELVVKRVTTGETLTPDRINWDTLPKAPSGKSGKSGGVVRLTEATVEALSGVVPSKYATVPKAIEAMVLAGVR